MRGCFKDYWPAKNSDDRRQPPLQAAAAFFPLETFAEFLNVPVDGLEVPMGHDGLFFESSRSLQKQ